MRIATAIFTLSLSVGSASFAWADTADLAREWLLKAVSHLCPLPDLTGFDAQLALPGSWFLEEQRLPNTSNPRLISVRLALVNGAELNLERRQFDGQLRQFRASFIVQDDGGFTPVMLAIADGSCVIQSGRLVRELDDVSQVLDQLDGDLKTLRWTETLQAPWPDGIDPGGPRIALIDSGLAYDLPIFRNRLARGSDGTPLGFDFWDMDPFPYDGDTSRSVFTPIRHGTAVASLLVQEAPDVALIPMRYPRPDMTRLADAVARAKEIGAQVIAMPLGSRNKSEWHAFEEALEEHDVLAIVSAGNDGRDIDTDPVYPAALDSEHILTVTSSDAFGRLAPGSNWGVRSVDIMLPAENLSVVDFRGAKGVASGSSYAVPRLAALAARLLTDEPSLDTAALRAKILARATPSPYERVGVVAAGWIPDPLVD